MPQVRATIDALDWQFAVTHQAFVNAFAYPGGRIFVTRGLLDMTTDEELAAVIGHEIGHVQKQSSFYFQAKSRQNVIQGTSKSPIRYGF